MQQKIYRGKPEQKPSGRSSGCLAVWTKINPILAWCYLVAVIFSSLNIEGNDKTVARWDFEESDNYHPTVPTLPFSPEKSSARHALFQAIVKMFCLCLSIALFWALILQLLLFMLFKSKLCLQLYIRYRSSDERLIK